MKPKYIEYYMRIAEETAKLSTARRLQVGTVIVKNNQTIATGYNGTFSGQDNNCEEWVPTGDYISGNVLRTHAEVYHSEHNAVLKLAKSTESSEGAAMFTTHSCCLPCAMTIAGAGIKDFYYRNDYRDDAGLNFLRKVGVNVYKCDAI